LLTPYQRAAGGLLVLGTALALAALVSINCVTRPMNALIAEGQRVMQGEPFHALGVAGPPDLQMLLQAVNQMVARLAEHQAALQRYAAQILRGQEEERLRLSRDLHDETVQDLVALNQRINLCSDLVPEDPVAAQELMEELRGLASSTLTHVHRMSCNLRPFVLENLGLGAALQKPPELELTTYHIAQESLNNVRKHAVTATRSAWCSFTKTGDCC
jgi:signal transduction histidine kinase